MHSTYEAYKLINQVTMAVSSFSESLHVVVCDGLEDFVSEDTGTYQVHSLAKHTYNSVLVGSKATMSYYNANESQLYQECESTPAKSAHSVMNEMAQRQRKLTPITLSVLPSSLLYNVVRNRER